MGVSCRLREKRDAEAVVQSTDIMQQAKVVSRSDPAFNSGGLLSSVRPIKICFTQTQNIYLIKNRFSIAQPALVCDLKFRMMGGRCKVLLTVM